MRVLLDTHVLINFAFGGLDRLSPRTRSLIKDTQTDRLISTVSLTEVALKTAIGKLTLDVSRIFEALDDLPAVIIPYTTSHVRQLFELPLLHREPFDRMLIATALAEDVPLVSIDREFPKYKGLRVLR